jgi:hypothetical protein
MMQGVNTPSPNRLSLYKKAGDTSPTNLRPIALQNAIAKIPSKILAARLSNLLNLNGAIDNANEGFLKGKNTGDALTSILIVWEDAKEFNKPCYCLSYDVSKAVHHKQWNAKDKPAREIPTIRHWKDGTVQSRI